MIPSIKLKKFSLKDREIFDKAYSLLEFPLAEHSFAWLNLWSDCYKDIEWAMVNGNLCLFLTFEGERHIWGPPLPGNKLADTLKICFSICNDYKGKNSIHGKTKVKYIPEELKEQYSNLKSYKLSEQNQDYIYLRKSIIELKGDKYKSKRNMKNYFTKHYDYKVEEYYAKKHKERCTYLLDKWKQQKEKSIKGEHQESLKDEYNANIKVLEYSHSFGLKGIVVYVDRKIEGYTFAEQTNNNICTDFFEKTNLEVKGLSVFIYGKLLKLFNTKYVNAGEDWDVDYLEIIKKSYHPYMIRKSYMLEPVLSLYYFPSIA